ncbi:hypothetical protein KFE25_006660 [Diacronema lutheri]|uniref:Heme oxygenase n=2 Tax=Diacronema lutheri TaxID=2081491 RepID=A0A8J5XMC5_DIALT|nr:hypothetical protein KFE25_006660 [Diacronema lutheri]
MAASVTRARTTARLALQPVRWSSSRSIFRGSKANKMGLSLELDALLRNSHDMRVFGLGFLVELSSRAAYARCVAQRLAYYGAMERRFDGCSTGAISKVWPLFARDLRRHDRLARDLDAVSDVAPSGELSPATRAYVRSIEGASPDALLGHFYTRYFADLFGGSMLGTPTELALGLPHKCAAYTFEPHVLRARGDVVERAYEAINECGDAISPQVRREIVDEARAAFAHNARMITERGGLAIGVGAARGVANLVGGYARKRLAPAVLGEIAGRIATRRMS